MALRTPVLPLRRRPGERFRVMRPEAGTAPSCYDAGSLSSIVTFFLNVRMTFRV